MNTVFWSSASNIYKSITQFLLIIILSRTLAPDEFGTFGLALISIQFLDQFAEFGMFSAIYYKQYISDSEFSSLFWFSLIIGFSLYLIVMMCGDLLGEFYNSRILSDLLNALGINLLFGAFGRNAKILLQRDLEFKEIALIEVLSTTLAFGLSIMGVILQFGVLSLVISSTVFTLFSNFGYVLVKRKHHSIANGFRLYEIRPLLKIGSYQLGSRIMDYFSEQIDSILIGKLYGLSELGGYTLMKSLVQRISGFVNGGLYHPITAKFSKLRNDLNLISAIISSTKLILLLNVIVFLPLIIFPSYLIKFIYGELYTNYSVILALLAGLIMLLSLGLPIGALQVARGRTDLGFFWTVFRFFVLLVSAYSSLLVSIEFFAASMLLIAVILNYLYVKYVAQNIVKLPLKDYYSVLHKRIVAIGVILIINKVLINIESEWYFSIVGFVIIVYTVFELWGIQKTYWILK